MIEVNITPNGVADGTGALNYPVNVALDGVEIISESIRVEASIVGEGEEAIRALLVEMKAEYQRRAEVYATAKAFENVEIVV